jgi:hypothetical protein
MIILCQISTKVLHNPGAIIIARNKNNDRKDHGGICYEMYAKALNNGVQC